MTSTGPLPLNAPVDPRLAGMVSRALAKRLALYVGAGSSISAGLPTGAQLAASFRTRAEALEITPLPPATEANLVEIADSLAATLGIRGLQDFATRVATFKSAAPSSGHRAIALAVLEGAIKVFTTNWDTCIERAAPTGEPLHAVVTNEDRHEVDTDDVVYKLHGCARRPSSLLVTSAQLEAPPTWADTDVAAALSQGAVVFLGIGDVAGYVAHRIEKLLEDLPDSSGIFVVSPTIEQGWNDTRWSELVPNLAPEAKIELDSDQFAEALLHSWVNDALASYRAVLGAMSIESLIDPFDQMIGALRTLTPEQLLGWLRASWLPLQAGHSVMLDVATRTALIALSSVLRGRTAHLRLQGAEVLRAEDGTFGLVISDSAVSGLQAAEAARSRVEVQRGKGLLSPDETVSVLCAGHVGLLGPAAGAQLISDIAGEPVEGDLIDGAAAGPIDLLDGQVVLASETAA